MKTVIIEYATISPSILSKRICKECTCLSSWKDVNEDYFEISFFAFCYPDGIVKAEKILAEYV